MVVGEMPQAIDLAVIGAGPGGYTAALVAAASGRTVHLVDAEGEAGVGGVCLWEGCIPSKAMIELGDAAHSADRRTAMGLPTADGAPDLERFQAWKNSIVSTLGSGIRASLRAAGVTVVQGHAVFTGARSLRVEHGDDPSETWEFRSAIIATGSSAARLTTIDGDPRVTDAAGVLSLTTVPTTAVVIGAGYIGIELGTAMAKLGSTVTIVEAAEKVLGGLGSHATDDVLRGLSRLGIRTITAAAVDGMDDAGVIVSTAAGRETLSADLVLVATGRTPNTSGLGLAAAGIETTASGHIVVDRSLLAAPNIAAIGDVIPGPGLAHRATAQAPVAVRAVAGKPAQWDAVVPSVIFSDPEVATVGISLAEARALSHDAAESVVPYGRAGRAHILQATNGHRTVVYDRTTGVLLGATITGIHATELISEFAVAIESGLLLADVTGTIHPHPTLSELATLEEIPA